MPTTLDVGTAAFHEIWISDQAPVMIGACEPEPTDRPVRMRFVRTHGAITDELRAAAAPPELLDQVLG